MLLLWVAPPHTEQVVVLAAAQKTAKSQEIRAPQRLCEDVRNVVRTGSTAYTKYLKLAAVNAVPDRVELDPNVLDLRVKYMILG
jgi:hypothetical protein